MRKKGVTILISGKIDIKTKAVSRDKEGHFITIKGSIEQEDVTLVNNYALNRGTTKYIKQMLTDMEEDVDSNIVIGRDLNTLVTSIDSSSR